MLVLFTPGAVKSDYVKIEYEVALAMQKPVLPVLCAACEVPDAFANKQYRDLTEASSYARELIALTRDVKAIAEARQQTVLQELSELIDDDSLSRFHAAIEKLQRWLNAGVYQTEIVAAVGWLFQQMNVDAQRGRTIQELIAETVDGHYIQRNWAIHPLYQEQKPVVDYIILTLAKDINEPSSDNGVAIVLAVMNDIESQELVNGTAFTNYPDELRKDFAELQSELSAKGIGDWARWYGPTPEQWLPFGSKGVNVSIRQLVKDVLDSLNRPGTRTVPQFIDIRTLDQKRSFLMKLRHEGCIVVIDSISMRHPSIQRAFQQSLLDAYPGTSVVNIAPLQSAFELVRNMCVILRLQVSDFEFEKRRRSRYEEYGGCRDIHEQTEFEQWLADRIGRLLPRPTRSNKGVRSQMYKGLKEFK